MISAVTPAMTIVPTSTLPPSSGNRDSPTSSSEIEASMSGSYSVWAGRLRDVPSSLSPNRGKKLSSVSPSTTSSPPVWACTCSCAISSSACSSINMGTNSIANTAMATNAPTIQRITSIFLSPDGSLPHQHIKATQQGKRHRALRRSTCWPSMRAFSWRTSSLDLSFHSVSLAN